VTRVGVNPVLAANGIAENIIVLGIDVVPVLIVPGGDKVAVTIRAHRRIVLVPTDVGIDHELPGLADRNRQFSAVVKAEHLDVVQGIGTLVAVRDIEIGHRHRGEVDGVIRSVPEERGNVIPFATA